MNMNKLNAYSEYELEKIARKANELYRQGNSKITDSQYDLIIERLEQLNPNNPFLKQVGYVILDDRKEPLPYRAGSLSKFKTTKQIYQFFDKYQIPKNTELIVTPKYDSIAMFVDELRGNAWTRGNGIEGQRSDEHFRLMTTPLNMPIYTFGEAIISNKNFEIFKDNYSNSRNMIAGVFNQKVPYKVKSQLLKCDYIRYGIRGTTLTKEEQLNLLNEKQTVKVPYIKTTIDNLTSEYLLSLYQEWSVDYLLDGLVIDINDISLVQKLGRDSKYNPLYAYAYKGNFEDKVDVKITSIKYQISKRGKVTPVLCFDETPLSGVNISAVTGFNMGYLRDNNIGIDSIITIKRSGEVIPNIVKVVTGSQFEIPSHLGKLEWSATNVELFVVGDNDEQKIQEIIHFYKTLDFEEVGYSFIKSLYYSGFDTISKTLQAPLKILKTIDGIGESKSLNFVNQIQTLKTRGVTRTKLMVASNLFPLLGERKLLLLEHFTTKPTPQQICNIKGFSDKSAYVFLNGWDKFNDFHSRSNIPIFNTSITQSGNYKVIFSGIRDKDLEKQIVNDGGEVVKSLKSKDTILIVKSKFSTSSKVKKAKLLGCNIYELNEFKKRFL